ncbi:hypothetical protein N7453_011364 [Penicillium expansum]|nr:hypothetical protein N7453_011364 [Penicillium expansum]
MATAYKIQLLPSDTGIFRFGGITPESAAKASELLQKNHDEYHIFFNEIGLHNHLAHHVLSLFAVGSSPELLQTQFDKNTSYQRQMKLPDNTIVAQMADAELFKSFLADGNRYTEFLTFFANEITQKGWQNVLEEYLFQGDERADDLLARMFEGYLHPIIHLGLGIEFNQPAIIAEALAQAAVHDNNIGHFLLSSERAARLSNPPSTTLIDLIDAVHKDPILGDSARWNDREKLVDGVLARASQELIKHGSMWKVKESELERRTAEMINSNFVFTFGAQRPPKRIKLDFYYIHCTNASIFFSSFLQQEWLSTSTKIRLLEWKGRMDLAVYASRGCPKILRDELSTYAPKSEGGRAIDWDNVIKRAMDYVDCHAIKLIRAMAHAEAACRPYKSDSEFQIKGDGWLRLAGIAMDSVEEEEGVEDWIRNVGFDEAWDQFPDRV